MSSLAQKHDTSETAHDDDDTSARAVKAPKLTTPAAPVCIMDGGMGHQLRRLGVEISGPIGSVERFLGKRPSPPPRAPPPPPLCQCR